MSEFSYYDKNGKLIKKDLEVGKGLFFREPVRIMVFYQVKMKK